MYKYTHTPFYSANPRHTTAALWCIQRTLLKLAPWAATRIFAVRNKVYCSKNPPTACDTSQRRPLSLQYPSKADCSSSLLTKLRAPAWRYTSCTSTVGWLGMVWPCAASALAVMRASTCAASLSTCGCTKVLLEMQSGYFSMLYVAPPPSHIPHVPHQNREGYGERSAQSLSQPLEQAAVGKTAQLAGCSYLQ